MTENQRQAFLLVGDILVVLCLLSLLGFVAWVMLTYIPMPALYRRVVIVVVVVLVVAWLIRWLSAALR